MRTLYLDCGMGAAGDMLTAALLELLPDRERFLERMNGLGIPNVKVSAEPCVKCGILGTHMHVEIHGTEEDEHLHEHSGAPETVEHGHSHAHEEGHGHSHTGFHGIEHLVKDHMSLPEEVRNHVLDVYQLIAEAESTVHGVPVSEIHFHEVGTMDAVTDITAVCLLLDELKPERIIASPVAVGSGTVRCAHGILPVPAPATAILLQGIPVYAGRFQSELCTPTGAALLKHFVSSYETLPLIKISKVGYGMGNRDFERANCVRAILGECD